MERRRNYFIKKRFQANFFLKFAFLLFIEAVLITALFMYASTGTLTTAYHGSELTIQKTGAYFFVSFLLISLIVGVTMGIAGIFVFMYLSHRIAGPLYKFEKTIAEAQKGDLAKRATLRKTDQLFDLREKMNEFLEEMDSRVSRVKEETQKGINVLKDEKTQGANLSDKIEKVLKDIKASLDYFTTSK